MNGVLSSLDTLRDAATWLQNGQPARACELLEALVRTQPGNVEAHRLLGSIYMQMGDATRAQRELRTCVQLRPGDSALRAQVAQVLCAAGRVADAVQLLEDALRQDPADVTVACALAQVWLGQGRPDLALRWLWPLTGRDIPRAAFWALLGHVLTLASQPAEAAKAFRRWLQLEPGSTEATLRLAAALADSGEPVEAEIMARAGIARTGQAPDATFILARALMGQGRFDEAENQLRAVVHARPEHVVAHNNLAELVWMRTGSVDTAGAEIDEALAANPRLTLLRAAKVRLLLGAGNTERALLEAETGLAFSPHDPELLKSAATVALNIDGERALDLSALVTRIAPRDREALALYGDASLAVGRARQALQVADALLQADPADGRSLALRADGLRMLGDPRCRELLNYTSFVRATSIDVPDGWCDLAAYLADLSTALERAHVFVQHPIGNSLRQGGQVVVEPGRSDDPAIRAFPRAIDRPIRNYMQALGRGGDPMRCRNNGGYRITGMWSVRLRPLGFHVNHYHPQGWISSAFYARIPPAVQGYGGEGWLKFGEPAYPTLPALGPEYFIRPEPGLLALFPSYMWHGTVPFSGDPEDQRLTIAFDVVPA